jgi:hypothetical protein
LVADDRLEASIALNGGVQVRHFAIKGSRGLDRTILIIGEETSGLPSPSNSRRSRATVACQQAFPVRNHRQIASYHSSIAQRFP